MIKGVLFTELRDELRPRVRDGARRLDQLLRGLQAHALLLHLAGVGKQSRNAQCVNKSHMGLSRFLHPRQDARGGLQDALHAQSHTLHMVYDSTLYVT